MWPLIEVAAGHWQAQAEIDAAEAKRDAVLQEAREARRWPREAIKIAEQQASRASGQADSPSR
jgi:hypothetical protein